MNFSSLDGARSGEFNGAGLVAKSKLFPVREVFLVGTEAFDRIHVHVVFGRCD